MAKYDNVGLNDDLFNFESTSADTAEAPTKPVETSELAPPSSETKPVDEPKDNSSSAEPATTEGEGSTASVEPGTSTEPKDNTASTDKYDPTANFNAQAGNIVQNHKIDNNKNNGLGSISQSVSNDITTTNNTTVSRKQIDPEAVETYLQQSGANDQRHGYQELMEKLQGGTPEELKAKRDKALARIARNRDRHQLLEGLRTVSDIFSSAFGGNVYNRPRPDYSRYDRDKLYHDNLYRSSVDKIYNAGLQDTKAFRDAIAKAYEYGTVTVKESGGTKVTDKNVLQGSTREANPNSGVRVNVGSSGATSGITGQFRLNSGDHISFTWKSEAERRNRLHNLGQAVTELDLGDLKANSLYDANGNVFSNSPVSAKQENNRRLYCAAISKIINNPDFRDMIFGSNGKTCNIFNDPAVCVNGKVSPDLVMRSPKYRNKINALLSSTTQAHFFGADGEKYRNQDNIDFIQSILSENALFFNPDLRKYLDPELSTVNF